MNSNDFIRVHWTAVLHNGGSNTHQHTSKGGYALEYFILSHQHQHAMLTSSAAEMHFKWQLGNWKRTLASETILRTQI